MSYLKVHMLQGLTVFNIAIGKYQLSTLTPQNWNSWIESWDSTYSLCGVKVESYVLIKIIHIYTHNLILISRGITPRRRTNGV